MTNIRLIVEGARASAEVNGLLTAGMVGIPVTIECDSTWDGLIKNLVCKECHRYGRFGGIVKTILDVGDSGTVAHEVMVGGSELYLGIEGYNSDGTLVIPTTWAYCGKIRAGAQSTGDSTADPTLPVWAQVKQELESVPQIINSALRDAKNSGEFDGRAGNGIESVECNDDYSVTLIMDDGTSYTTPSIRGATGADGKDGSNGKDGTSVSVSSISESTEDGGSNVVTFSDGKTLTVKNGKTGATGAAGYTPVKGTDYYTEADKAEMVDEVQMAMDGVPSYWQTALDEGVEAINTALCEAGRNKSAFLFYSDAHWNYGSQMSPTLLKYMYRHTGVTKTFFGGDIVNDEATDYDTMEYLWDWRKQLKDLPNHHSVVGNHDDGNSTNNLFSEQYVYGYLLGPEETPDIIRGDGMYYYVDSPAEKTRYLCLDTAYKGVDSAQQEFVKSALLTTPSGWHIVAISHIWHDTNYNTTPPTIGAINSSASTLLSMFESYNSRNGDYAECTGWVEFCIGGHTHWDYDSTSALGIPIILVETDSQHTRSGLTYTAGTTTEASVNGIIADYDKKTIKVVCIGRGASREVEMTWFEVAYTNLIPTATDMDGVTIYNGVGYKENIRLSGSSGQFRDNTGSDCTGYIKTPVGEAFTVYMKNITANTNNNYGFCVSLLNGTGVALTDGFDYATNIDHYSPQYDDNGNVIQFTVSADKAHGYMVISAVNIDDASIVTINEPIS